MTYARFLYNKAIVCQGGDNIYRGMLCKTDKRYRNQVILKDIASCPSLGPVKL